MTSDERRESYEYLKRKHICVDCHKKDERTMMGFTRCNKCAAMAKTYALRYQKKKDDEKERLKEIMCNDYCRYPMEWDEDAEGVELRESDHCRNCPLDKL